jgi:hypothetical protein
MSRRQFPLKVVKGIEKFALTNCVYVNPADFAVLQIPESLAKGLPARNYIAIKGFVYSCM